MSAMIESLEKRTLFAGGGQVVDLVPVSITPVTPTLIGGTSVTSVIGVLNNGPGTAKGKVKAELIASPDDSLDQNDRVLASLVKNVNIKPSLSYNFSLNKVKWPGDLTAGDYRLFARITPQSFADSDLSNNVFGSATKVSYAPPVVDYGLAFTDESQIPGNIPFKKRTSISFTITNLGNVTATKPVAFGAYLSNDQMYDAADKYLAGVMRPFKLAPGQSQTFVLNFATNKTFTAGSYYIIGGIDTKNAIAEPDDFNNWVTTTIKHSF